MTFHCVWEVRHVLCVYWNNIFTRKDHAVNIYVLLISQKCEAYTCWILCSRHCGEDQPKHLGTTEPLITPKRKKEMRKQDRERGGRQNVRIKKRKWTNCIFMEITGVLWWTYGPAPEILLIRSTKRTFIVVYFPCFTGTSVWADR